MQLRGKHASLASMPIDRTPADLDFQPSKQVFAANFDDQTEHQHKALRSEASHSLLTAEASASCRELGGADYELLLQDTLNLENLQNKLYVKKNLIAQAVGKHHPKRQRMFAGDIITQLKEMGVRRILELPGNLSMQMTKEVARSILYCPKSGSVDR